MNTEISRSMIGFRDSLRSSLLSLFKVAYNSRCSLPLLISVGFMLLDLHMRLELEIEAHVQPGPEPNAEGVDINSNNSDTAPVEEEADNTN